MDQSPKAKSLMRKYDEEMRHKWFRRIANRVRKLNCCMGGNDKNSAETDCGGHGDTPGHETYPPCLVLTCPVILRANKIMAAATYIQDNGASKDDNMDSFIEDDLRQIFNPSSLKDLAIDAYSRSKAVPKRRRRRHAFYQEAYTGGFHSYVGR